MGRCIRVCLEAARHAGTPLADLGRENWFCDAGEMCCASVTVPDSSPAGSPHHQRVAERDVWREVTALGRHGRWLFKNLYSGLVRFEENLIAGRPNQWRSRAGARYLYVCEDRLVHYCSQQRGTPGIPLARYGVEAMRREYWTPKSCAALCTVGCVHRASIMDFWRDPLPTLDDRGRGRQFVHKTPDREPDA
jgi:hypothetical protein